MKHKIRFVFVLLVTFFASSALSQISTVPFGSSNLGIPPVGAKKSGGDCKSGGCLEFNIKPACFGTNLRAYSGDKQMKENEDVVVEMKLKNKEDPTKIDNIRVRYPARLTFASAGARKICTIDAGQNMNNGSPKSIKCTNQDGQTVSTYMLMNWKVDKNPSCYANGGSHGQEFCDYAGVTLSANGPETLSCVYNFGSNYKIDKTKVSCLFESQLTDESSAMTVTLNGQNISSTVEKEAYTNKLKLKISNGITSMNLNPVVHHGELQPAKTPHVDFDFYQISNSGTQRAIASIIEDKSFDEANANRSFSLYVKHPGVEGFCGGFYSPLMLFFGDNYPEFKGVSTFPLYGMKEGQRVNWPEKNAEGYFLVNLNGKENVESDAQLFGKSAKYANGFEALKAYDDNKDGVINKKDKIFSKLKLWKDSNSNGLSDKGELISLKDKNVKSISLKYSDRDTTKFGHRARAREKSLFTYVDSKGKSIKSNIYDIWLAPID